MENTTLAPGVLRRLKNDEAYILRARGELTLDLEAALRRVGQAGTPALRGITERDGTITLTWNMQVAKLLSPDGELHCLPCEVCGGLQWVGLEVVSIVCDDCTVDHMGL